MKVDYDTSLALISCCAAAKQNDNRPVEKDETKVGAATGKIVNMMSADVYQVRRTAIMFCGSAV